MKRYIYEACWTQGLEDEIESAPSTKALIEEMYYRFGLKVYGKEKGSLGREFLMTLDGLPYCKVFTEVYWNEVKEVSEITYYYYSQYYSKARGKNEDDKHTLRSTKLSKLMTTLEKNNAIMPDHSHLLTFDILTDVTLTVKRKGVKAHKSMYDLEDTSKLQLLLEHAVNKAPLEGETLKGFQVILDKWTKADHDVKQATNKMEAMFGNEFYIIGETQDEGFAIASARVTDFSNNRVKYELVKPFQRVMSLDDYEYIDEIRPVLTMYKLFLEGEDKHRSMALSPMTREYYEDLNIVTTYSGYPAGSSFIPLWTLIPTITE